MYKQLDIFTDEARTLARSTDPVTSHEAASKAIHFKEDHKRKILEALKQGDMGKSKIAKVTGLTGTQVARRLPELWLEGKVEPTGNTVKSDANYNEREWRLKV